MFKLASFFGKNIKLLQKSLFGKFDSDLEYYHCTELEELVNKKFIKNPRFKVKVYIVETETFRSDNLRIISFVNTSEIAGTLESFSDVLSLLQTAKFFINRHQNGKYEANVFYGQDVQIDIYVSRGFKNYKISDEAKFVAMLKEICFWSLFSQRGLGITLNYTSFAFILAVVAFLLANGINITKDLIFQGQISDEVWNILKASGTYFTVVSLVYFLTTLLNEQKLEKETKSYVRNLGNSEILEKYSNFFEALSQGKQVDFESTNKKLLKFQNAVT